MRSAASWVPTQPPTGAFRGHGPSRSGAATRPGIRRDPRVGACRQRLRMRVSSPAALRHGQPRDPPRALTSGRPEGRGNIERASAPCPTSSLATPNQLCEAFLWSVTETRMVTETARVSFARQHLRSRRRARRPPRRVPLRSLRPRRSRGPSPGPADGPRHVVGRHTTPTQGPTRHRPPPRAHASSLMAGTSSLGQTSTYTPRPCSGTPPDP